MASHTTEGARLRGILVNDSLPAPKLSHPQPRLGISFKRSTNTHTLATLGLVRFLIGASIVRTQPEPQYCVVPEDLLHDVIWSSLVIEVGQLDQEGTGFLCDKSLVSQNEPRLLLCLFPSEIDTFLY